MRDLGRTGALLRLAVRHFARPFLRWLIARPQPSRQDVRVRFRRFLEQGGVTTIKVGQYLAIRRDLFSSETCAELSRLLDHVAQMPFAEVRAAVERELGQPLERTFARFDTAPLGSASIAQVHRALDRQGRAVAVKVQRYRVGQTLEADFRILRRAARLADRFRLLGEIRAEGLVGEIEAFTMREADFIQEARAAERMAGDPESGVHIPAIYWNLTTRRLLVMELITGRPLAWFIKRARAGDTEVFARIVPQTPPGAIVDRLCHAFLRQLFVTGHFQGDPHPANVMIEPDGTVALIDFGIFGQLDPGDRETLAGYVESLSLGRLERAFYWYSALVAPSDRTDFHAFRRDTIAVLRRWHRAATDPAAGVERRLTARYQGEMFEVMRRHRVRMGTDLLLFWRALAVLDATAHQLPASFDLLAAMRGFFAERRTSVPVRALEAGHELAHRSRAMLPDWIRLLARFPLPEAVSVEGRPSGAERLVSSAAAKGVALMLAAVALAAHAAAVEAEELAVTFGIGAVAALLVSLRRTARLT